MNVTIESIKGRRVKLTDGRNISRAQATEMGLMNTAPVVQALTIEHRHDTRREEARREDDELPVTHYTGPMLALRERVKAGAYKKAANGQPSCGDALAQALGVLQPTQVIRACLIALAYDANPYTHLNIGQQSMNLRNRVRNALTRGDFGMGVVVEAVEEVQEVQA